MNTPLTTSKDIIITILQSEPFRKFTLSDLQRQLPDHSEADIEKTMVDLFQGGENGIIADGTHGADGEPDVEWLSYFED